MDCNDFITCQLATTGWAPIHPDLAKFLQPELHSAHQIAAWLTVPDALLHRFPRTELVRAKIEDFGVVPILARSTLALAERIAFITGGEVGMIEAENAPQRLRAPDISTGNPPRSCRECGNLTNAGNCLPAMMGEWPERPREYRPDASRPRRCQRYTPGHDLLTGEHRDYRTGGELWPDPPTTKAPAAPAAEPAGASEKARELLSEMLKDGPQPAARIIEAGQAAGLSERTIQRAGERLGVGKTKDGHGGWTWALPKQGAKVAA